MPSVRPAGKVQKSLRPLIHERASFQPAGDHVHDQRQVRRRGQERADRRRAVVAPRDQQPQDQSRRQPALLALCARGAVGITYNLATMYGKQFVDHWQGAKVPTL